jgi:hypothetical protein
MKNDLLLNGAPACRQAGQGSSARKQKNKT